MVLPMPLPLPLISHFYCHRDPVRPEFRRGLGDLPDFYPPTTL